ncbi:VirB4 family type IV secretion/conjugal transfer ATPase (plasmid) [Agrobacterium rosae]|uniref:Type IV secretion system protein virB4 n=1 Tax=Agrobacterium rosae TaxID=1972867 RepID=A0ABU4W4H0_9HYPH|nr:VirB4 family type IV secretion/conjugal transfer ATPase [Agrobacterium rosae]MDX8331876.1 VirB4 family type IV secretion/conjugal transfer ATPase [Agrobacterium rosae]
MNIINHDLTFGKERRGEMAIGRHVPYLRHINEETVVTRTGMLLQVIRLSGLPYQTMDQAEINARLANRNMTVRSLGSSRFALYATIVRRRITLAIGGDFDIAFADELNARYMDGLQNRTMFVNELYITVIRRPMTGRAGKVDRMFDWLRLADNETEARAEVLRDLTDMVTGIVGDFRSYRPEVLSCVTREGAVYSEPAEFFAKILAAGEERTMPVPRMSLADYVGTGRIMFGRKAMEIASADGTSSKLAAMVSIKEYPPMTTPGQLDGLLRLPYELIVTHSFAPEDRVTVTEAISTIARQISNSDDGGTTVEDDIETARDRLASGEVVFGKHHMSVAVLASDMSKLNRAVADVTAELARMGVVAVREDLNQEAAWWAQLPANFAYIARQGMISSVNFAGLFSAHNFPSGQTQKLHWKQPISLLETTSQTAYFFNFHEDDVGNFTIVGPTGSGKTVALSFLLAQSMRVQPRPRCVFIDKDRGGEIFVRAMGGRYERLSPGEPTGFAPFQLEDTPANRVFGKTLVSYLVTPGDRVLNAEEISVISDAVDSIFDSFDRHQRRLDMLTEALKGRMQSGIGDLADRLKEWTTGDKGWLFNNSEDQIDFSGALIGFDMTEVLSDKRTRTAALLYMFHRIQEILDGTPSMIFLDEGWRLLDDEVFSGFIKDWLKTIRKMNGIVGFGTQSAADIVRSDLRNTIIEQTMTNIFFPNASADEESYRRAFGLSAKEFRFVKQADKASRTFLIKHAQDSIIARLDLTAMPDLVKVLSGRPETVRECEELRKIHGDDPAAWLPHFCEWDIDEGEGDA